MEDDQREPAPKKHTKKIIRPKDMPDETGLSIRAVWEQVAAENLPPPIQLGPRSVGWLSNEIDAWRERKRSERDERIRTGKSLGLKPEGQKRPRGRPRKDQPGQHLEAAE